MAEGTASSMLEYADREITEAQHLKLELIALRDRSRGGDKRILRKAIQRIERLERTLMDISVTAMKENQS